MTHEEKAVLANQVADNVVRLFSDFTHQYTPLVPLPEGTASLLHSSVCEGFMDLMQTDDAEARGRLLSALKVGIGSFLPRTQVQALLAHVYAATHDLEKGADGAP